MATSRQPRRNAQAALTDADAREAPRPSPIHARIADARVALRMGQLGHARAQVDRALLLARAQARELPHADHVGHALAMRADVMAGQGDAGRARDARSEALRHLEATLGNDAPAVTALRRQPLVAAASPDDTDPVVADVQDAAPPRSHDALPL